MIGWGRADNEILERDFPFSGIYKKTKKKKKKKKKKKNTKKKTLWNIQLVVTKTCSLLNPNNIFRLHVKDMFFHAPVTYLEPLWRFPFTCTST